MNTGTRTQVQVTARSGMSRILRLSSRNFCSSLVSPEPSSTSVPGQGEHVVGDDVGEDGRRRELDRRAVEGEGGGAVDRLDQLLLELGHAGQARPRHGLVGGDDQPLAARPRRGGA